jgi:hypothetical protein
MTVGDPATAAARDRVEDVLERFRRVDLQVVVVAAPDPVRVGARDRARQAAVAAGRAELFDEAAEAAREATLRAFARGGFTGTWAATEMAMSVASAADRVAAAAAFEEAAMAAVVEDIVDDETLETLRATAEELDSSTGIPAQGDLSILTRRATSAPNVPLVLGVLLASVALGGVIGVTVGLVFGVIVFGIGGAIGAWLARRRSGFGA